MLSIGSAAYLADKELLGTFSANLETLPASAPDPKTAAWWATQPEAWSACRQNLEAPAVALKAGSGEENPKGVLILATQFGDAGATLGDSELIGQEPFGHV